MEELSTAFQQLSAQLEETTFDIDESLHRNVDRQKRRRLSSSGIRSGLEADFLAPSHQFSTQWLNQLQQRWDMPSRPFDLLEMAPTQTRIITRFTREGLEGRVTGYKEVTVPASSATAKNSTSILRKPANRADFVRGAAGFFPFAPGGLDGVEAVAMAEDEAMAQNETSAISKRARLDRVINVADSGAMLQTPPGFERGMDFSNKKAALSKTAVDVEKTLLEEPQALEGGITSNAANGKDHDSPQEGEVSETSDDEIEALLPVEFPSLAPRGDLLPGRSALAPKSWAHMVELSDEMPDFYELVPDMAKDWPFELDVFQKEAIYHLENSDSVFVAAHTSAGKTVVAEYAIALAAKHMTKAIYTSPIKALSNQKFRDFKNVFDDVGILTGDVQIRPEASCLIMTTEILRSMLYRGADIIRDVEFVIFDEVHYVNDLERGVVWEEVIIMLPEHVTLILLSATVPNTYEFASWVGRTKKKNIYVISTSKRPVPLEHYLWGGKDLFKIVDAEKKFIEKGWKNANEAISGKDKVKPPKVEDSQRGGANQRSGQGRGRGANQRGAPQRGGSQQRERGQPLARGRGNIARTGRGGGRTSAAQDRNLWVHLVQHLRKENLLPACIFVFSKKRCEQNADALSNLDYCTSSEKSAIHIIVEKSLARLKPEDRVLPQIRRLRELLSRGIAVHHGGMLPIVKEVVEILFAKTLVKVLFATETFAMGLNLPTRTVAFSGYRKHDGRSFRDLLPGEYTQMAGRAGRRGIDTVGTVIIVMPGAEEAPPVAALRQMMLGVPTKLRSQFRLTYNMILNLLRVEALKIEEMIKRSFSEHATQALLPEHEKAVKLTEADLAKIKREPCDICDADLEQCHQASMNFQRTSQALHRAVLESPIGRRTLGAKRLIVYKKDNVRMAGILFGGVAIRGDEPAVQVLEITAGEKRKPSDTLPYLAGFAKFFDPLASRPNQMKFKATIVPLADIECVTESAIKVDLPALLKKDPEAVKRAKDLVVPMCRSWNYQDWDEVGWHRIKGLHIHDLLKERSEFARTAQGGKCLSCPKFTEHFLMQHDEWLLKEHISELQKLMSDQNLQLLPDYEQRVAVLKDLGFIDDKSRVELKGKVACEIHSADELVLTELVLENVLANYEPEEIVALLSAFVFQEKTETVPQLTRNLERGIEQIVELSEKVNNLQTLHQVILAADDSNDFVSRPRFGMVEVVYEWARGMSFNRITDLTDVMEGTIVRCITRLDETCREVKNAARIIGDPTLFTKMQACQEMIKRDICATASLYM